MQCGCECVRCRIGGEISTDSTACNALAFSATEIDCLERDKSNCGPQFSDDSQIAFCPISSPSRWPPLFELTDALDPPPADGGGGAGDSTETNSSSIGTSGEAAFGRRLQQAAAAPRAAAMQFETSTYKMAYTASGSNSFADDAMATMFRQPNVDGLVQALSSASGSGASVVRRLPFFCLHAYTLPLHCSGAWGPFRLASSTTLTELGRVLAARRSSAALRPSPRLTSPSCRRCRGTSAPSTRRFGPSTSTRPSRLAAKAGLSRSTASRCSPV